MEEALDRNAVASSDHQQYIPRSWRWFLLAIEAGKGAVGGVGLFIALAGLEQLFNFVTTGEVSSPSATVLKLMSVIGALLGAIYACVRPLLRSR
jgi:xanthine/uracil/vitamin C permease (AzgA family)